MGEAVLRRAAWRSLGGRKGRPPARQRLPLHHQTQEVLGLAIRKVVIPVEAGRNIAVLLEAAVRNTILQMRGIDTLANFMERQQRAMGGE